MPVTLNIVESTTELGQEVVEVVLASASTPGPAGPGVPAGGTVNQVLTKDSGTDYDTSWQDATGGAGGAPTDVDYLVGTASGDLSAEIVVGTTPGGELGGTWASPTVDATHSGSSHASVQAAAEATAASALATHTADTTAVHGIADTSALALTANHPTNATFNDHSARHENGGADEISLAGLDGTPTDLQTHLDDATAAHAGSAVSVDSTSLSGTATTVQGSLEELDNLLDDHSARHENGGADEISIAGLDGTPTELANHLSDATDAHDASAISVLDTGTFYTATDVEGVLAEIAPQLGGGTGEALQRAVAQTGHGLAVGNVVRYDGADYVKAQANSAVNAEVVGLVAVVPDTDNFTLHYGGRITGLSGLSAGSVYYLDDDTAGLLTTTEPPDAGDISKPLLVADSTTSGYFFNWRGALNIDMATQAELDAHVNDASDAHDASAISLADAGGNTSETDVEGAIDELYGLVGGGETLIEEIVVGAGGLAVADFQSIPDTYQHLRIDWQGNVEANGDFVVMRFNNDGANNYARSEIHVGGSQSGTVDSGIYVGYTGDIAADTDAEAAVGTIDILYYKRTVHYKACVFQCYSARFGGDSAQISPVGGGNWRSTAAITRVQIFRTSNDWAEGSIFRLYGRP